MCARDCDSLSLRSPRNFSFSTWFEASLDSHSQHSYTRRNLSWTFFLPLFQFSIFSFSRVFVSFFLLRLSWATIRMRKCHKLFYFHRNLSLKLMSMIIVDNNHIACSESGSRKADRLWIFTSRNLTFERLRLYGSAVDYKLTGGSFMASARAFLNVNIYRLWSLCVISAQQMKWIRNHRWRTEFMLIIRHHFDGHNSLNGTI